MLGITILTEERTQPKDVVDDYSNIFESGAGDSEQDEVRVASVEGE